MRVINISPTLLHGIGMLAIALLTAFVVRERINDHDEILQTEWQFAFSTSTAEIEKASQSTLAVIEKTVTAYANDRNKDYQNRARMIVSKTDSMMALIDSLQRKPSAPLLYAVQGKLQVFRSQLWQIVDFDPPVEASIDYFIPADWLSQSWKNSTPLQFLTILQKTIAEVCLIQMAALKSIESRSTGHDIIDCSYPGVQMCFDQIAAAVGDSVVATMWLGWHSNEIDDAVIRLNGQVLSMREGSAKFKVRYEQPGVYPLHFSVENRDIKTDSIRIWPKTYYLRVR